MVRKEMPMRGNFPAFPIGSDRPIVALDAAAHTSFV